MVTVGELRNHERASRVAFVGKQIGLREGLFERFNNLPRPEGRQPSQGFQGLLGVYLVEDRREDARAEALADASRLHGIHLAQHPDHGFGRHQAQKRVAARARQAREDASDVGWVEMLDEVPGRLFPACLDQVLDCAGNACSLTKRDRLWLFGCHTRARRRGGPFPSSCICHPRSPVGHGFVRSGCPARVSRGRQGGSIRERWRAGLQGSERAGRRREGGRVCASAGRTRGSAR